jgi:hypothetical protein
MSVNPIEPNNTDKPTGSLEELFRHHMAEAAVPPRPMLWEQIDHSLLLSQNETYRRRLATMRWVAAASLFLATLAGTGWWARRDAIVGGELAANRPQTETSAAARGSESGNGAAGSESWGASQQRLNLNGAANSPATAATTAGSARLNADAALAGRNSYASAATAQHENAQTARHSGFPTTTPSAVAGRAGQAREAAALDNPGNSIAAMTTAGRPAGQAATSTAAPGSSVASTSVAYQNNGLGLGRPARNDQAALAGLEANSASTLAATANPVASSAVGLGKPALPASIEQLDFLAARSASLNLNSPTALPTGLTAMEVPADGTPPALSPARKWQFGASLAVGAFQPNTNFSRAGIAPEFDYNPALGPDSPAITEAAAVEHRDNLRAGLSQRLAVRATRRLGGRWALSTGLEVSQSYAKSASTVAFMGEQVPDFGPNTRGELRTTDFRYRMAGIPVEVRYANPVKRGWSAYGRLGAVVNALLGVRSEVEGLPEVTRTYTLTSAGTPYRRVLANVRGGAGAQFRPATGHWSLTMGPVAEVGLLSLNAHPVQDFMAQSRPYSVGLEAAVEFGRSPK